MDIHLDIHLEIYFLKKPETLALHAIAVVSVAVVYETVVAWLRESAYLFAALWPSKFRPTMQLGEYGHWEHSENHTCFLLKFCCFMHYCWLYAAMKSTDEYELESKPYHAV
jgi:hypothetical protein